MRIHIACHAETVFNVGGRMQGAATHTPLTRRGIAQAEAMGAALDAALGSHAGLPIWSSPTGRTLQTASIVAEHLGRGFFDIRVDPRLNEIDVGDWTGRLYADVDAAEGPILCPDRGVFRVRPPGGEWYPAVAARLACWLADVSDVGELLVVTHGMSSRVLRGLLVGGEPFEGVRLAEPVPQGSVLTIEAGAETLLHRGAGVAA